MNSLAQCIYNYKQKFQTSSPPAQHPQGNTFQGKTFINYLLRVF